MTAFENDTITAIASSGGIGVIRVSGAKALSIAIKITKKTLSPRVATFSNFYDPGGIIIDNGIVLFFSAPQSYTGEDVVELQCHGGYIVLDELLRATLNYGARQARPGEFTERAFLNNKIDLIQAEAVADLITASSATSARAATHSLQGAFSNKINQLIDALISLRVYIEAAMDFPEEEVDFLTEANIKKQLADLKIQLVDTLNSAHQGALLVEGLTVVIAGRPNVGKSSLLNALSERESAIVTPIAGTTRDVLREHIQIDGMPLHIIDTAGLRQGIDPVEQEGIRRAIKEIENADQILLVTDSSNISPADIWPNEILPLPKKIPITIVKNKCDLTNDPPEIKDSQITLSAKTGAGISLLKERLKRIAHFNSGDSGKFSARRRHVNALEKTTAHIDTALLLLEEQNSNEILAEELRLAQQELEIITGRFAPDDLLEKIFRDFCIGK